MNKQSHIALTVTVMVLTMMTNQVTHQTSKQFAMPS